jgi:hypothetical protein
MRALPNKPCLTYANVISTVALFVALGGASYAASGGLAPGSVGTRQLRNRSVTPPKLAFGYASGVVERFSGREFSIGERPPACSRRAQKCGPPGFEGKRVAETSVTLTRPSRIMIMASALVTNYSHKQAAWVAPSDIVQGARSPENVCFSQTVVPRNSVETVSCAGVTDTLRPGKYLLKIFEGAWSSTTPGIKATAEQPIVVWWTLPPSAHGG